MDNPLVQPDPGLYIWTIATFLVLAGLLAKFAWKPLLAALAAPPDGGPEAPRAAGQDATRKSLDEARQAKTELERLHVESQRILAQARTEAESILAATRSDANQFREGLQQKGAPARGAE